MIIVSVNDKFSVSVADSQENLPGGMDPALLELLVQPGRIQAHAPEIACQNPAVHDQLGKQQLLLWGELQIAGGRGALGAHRKDRQLSVELEDCGLDAGEVKGVTVTGTQIDAD